MRRLTLQPAASETGASRQARFVKVDGEAISHCVRRRRRPCSACIEEPTLMRCRSRAPSAWHHRGGAAKVAADVGQDTWPARAGLLHGLEIVKRPGPAPGYAVSALRVAERFTLPSRLISPPACLVRWLRPALARRCSLLEHRESPDSITTCGRHFTLTAQHLTAGTRARHLAPEHLKASASGRSADRWSAGS